jgi:hypothetical protein
MWPVILGREYAGSLTSLHKVKDGRNIYFFANSSSKSVDTEVVLRGSLKLSIWDPMDGRVQPVEARHSKHTTGEDLTAVPLKLKPVTAVFLVQET